jgi:hypothetical protein
MWSWYIYKPTNMTKENYHMSMEMYNKQKRGTTIKMHHYLKKTS